MCQPVQPIYFPWPDIPFAFAESDGAIKSAAPTRNLGDGAFLTPPAKIIRTGSMQTARGTPVVPGSGGGAVGKPRDPPATSQLSHAKAAQQVVVKKEPGVDDPKPNQNQVMRSLRQRPSLTSTTIGSVVFKSPLLHLTGL